MGESLRPFEHTIFDVWVPKESDGPHGIDVGSGIVGTPDGEDIRVDFEGNRGGHLGEGATFADCVRVAAGRHHTGYRTVARGWLPATSLIHVGTYDPANGEVRLLDRDAALALHEWCGDTVLDARELFTTTPKHRARRAYIGRVHNSDPGTVPQLPPDQFGVHL